MNNNPCGNIEYYQNENEEKCKLNEKKPIYNELKNFLI